MYQGEVILIKRSKLTHVGVRTNGYLASVCNCTWTIKDKTSKGDTSKVTCKRCLKILSEANEDGSVDLSKTKRNNRG